MDESEGRVKGSLSLQEDEFKWLSGGSCPLDKISRIADVKFSPTRNGSAYDVEISAPDERAITRAKRYVEVVLAQRRPNLKFTLPEGDDDYTLVPVPEVARRWVTGKNGNTLRSIEKDTNTLLFFGAVNEPDGTPRKPPENANTDEWLVVISPSLRARIAADIRVRGVVEIKDEARGYYSSSSVLPQDLHLSENVGPDIDWMRLKGDEVSYALGSKSATKFKIATAAGCSVEVAADVVFFGGTRAERDRAREYLTMVLNQRKHGSGGDVDVALEGRTDVSTVTIPADAVGYVSGSARRTMTGMEAATGTFMAFLPEKERDTRLLAVFSHSEASRAAGVLKVQVLVDGRTKNHAPECPDGDSKEPGLQLTRMPSAETADLHGHNFMLKDRISGACGGTVEATASFVYVLGDLRTRTRAWKFVRWSRQRCDRRVAAGRPDLVEKEECADAAEVVPLTTTQMEWLTSRRSHALDQIEVSHRAVLFFARVRDGDAETLAMLVCAADDPARRVAADALRDILSGAGADRARDRSLSRGRRRSRTPERRRDDYRDDYRRDDYRRDDYRRDEPRRDDYRRDDYRRDDYRRDDYRRDDYRDDYRRDDYRRDDYRRDDSRRDDYRRDDRRDDYRRDDYRRDDRRDRSRSR